MQVCVLVVFININEFEEVGDETPLDFQSQTRKMNLLQRMTYVSEISDFCLTVIIRSEAFSGSSENRVAQIIEC